MELKDYTTEELRAELKRRAELIKAEKADVVRCRNCKFLKSRTSVYNIYYCQARTWGKYNRHYIVKRCTKGCDKFERNEQ